MKTYSILAPFLVLLIANGCAIIENSTSSGASNHFDTSKYDIKFNPKKIAADISSKFSKPPKLPSGFNPKKALSSISSQFSTKPDFATRFKSNEVPNTLMTKPVAKGRLTSTFGFRLNPAGVPVPKTHKGIDYAAPEGTQIYASGDGIIDKIYVSKSYGNYIRIKHTNSFSSAYAHMQKFADGLSKGSSVKRGQVIGTIGTTGQSTGPHLHYELLYQGKQVNPLFK